MSAYFLGLTIPMAVGFLTAGTFPAENTAGYLMNAFKISTAAGATTLAGMMALSLTTKPSRHTYSEGDRYTKKSDGFMFGALTATLANGAGWAITSALKLT